MTKKIILILILVVSITGTVIVGCKIIQAIWEYHKGNEIYSQIADIAYSSTIEEEQQITTLSANEKTDISSLVSPNASEEECGDNVCPMPGADNISETPFVTLSPSPILISSPMIVLPTVTQTQDIHEAVQKTVNEKKIKSAMNFDNLKEINEDVKGWIHLSDSKVDYPVLQYKDNDFYLHHAITGEWNKVGTPFIDYRCTSDFSDRITVIYGHYMENGTMFTDLHKYKGQKYYEEHPIIDLYTPSGDYDIIPVAGVFQNVEYWDFTFDFDTDASFLHYIDNWKAVSTFKSDTTYDKDDKFVILTLCTYDIDNGRFMLVGKLEPKKQS